ncbi:hypothetical protein, partial [Saccharibacter floricola]|uniref:hypothetical protein n=1 Tax=Saccharibacter floricola TaxID=231053 RepID=UPI001B7F850C
ARLFRDMSACFISTPFLRLVLICLIILLDSGCSGSAAEGVDPRAVVCAKGEASGRSYSGTLLFCF